MSNQSYERTIQTTAPSADVYAALTTRIAQWWTSDAGTFEKAKLPIQAPTTRPRLDYGEFWMQAFERLGKKLNPKSNQTSNKRQGNGH